MTKKDYELLAYALRSARPTNVYPKDGWAAKYVPMQWDVDVKAIASALGKDNYRFMPSTFIKACGGLFSERSDGNA